MRLRLIVLASMVALLLAAPAGALAAKSYKAQRFDAVYAIQNDGSINVTETVVFEFSGGPFTNAYRTLPKAKADTVTVTSGQMDGRPVPLKTDVDSNDIEVRWNFEATSDSVHTFVLTYVLQGVIQQGQGVDTLRWTVLPTRHDYTIDASTVTIAYPARSALAGAPAVERGTATVRSEGRTVVFQSANLRRDATLVVNVPFAPGLVAQAPQWQQRDIRNNETAPAAILAGLGVLVVGLVGLIRYWQGKRPDVAVMNERDLHVTRPPYDLPPAPAGYITRGTSAWANALGTFLALARRGVLAIEETGESAWYRKHSFIIRLRLQDRPGDLSPHEQGLLRLLFETKQGMQTSMKMSDLRSALAQRWKLFSDPLEQDMRSAGLLSEERVAVRNRFYMAGALLLGLALVAAVAIALLMNAIGAGFFIVPFVVFFLAIAAFSLGAAYTPFSDRALQQAPSWKAFARYLKDVAKGKEAPLPMSLFEQYFPYAVSFGQAGDWAGYLKKKETVELPAWFHAVSATPDQAYGAFVAWVAAASATSSAGASGGAAGAGGGGASGAS